MTQLITHQQFFQHTTGLAQELAQIKNSLKQQEQELFTNIRQVNSAVENAGAMQGKGKTAVNQAVHEYFAQINKVLNAWEKRVKNYEIGLSFREKFGDSLLVFVYGKVKAGKSSLGNFIATGRGKPDAEWMQTLEKQLHKPDFFMEEKNNKFNEKINFEQGFQVGAEETTSCIQGFRVPGLTWVDSPGLHSVTDANGELAERYVESADLVIYPMNSAQPGRNSDLEELEDLLRMKKRILVLITRSDEIDTDVDEETGEVVHKLIMKSDEKRQSQVDYVQKELQELCEKMGLADVDTSALSISVDYAEKNGNSEEAMQASGLSALFEKLDSTLKSEGVELKKQVPMRNLQAFYAELLNPDPESELSIIGLTSPLQQALASVEKLKDQLPIISERALATIENEYAGKVDELVEQAAASRNIKDAQKQLDIFLDGAIQKHYKQELDALCQQTLHAMMSTSREMGLAVDIDFENKTRDIQVDVSAKSKAVGGGLGSVLGGVAGALVGGPLGAVAGAALGGLGGSAAGAHFSHSETRTIVSGDNREEIKDILLKKGNALIEQTINGIQQQYIENIFNPVLGAINNVSQEVTSLEQYIQQKRSVNHV